MKKLLALILAGGMMLKEVMSLPIIRYSIPASVISRAGNGLGLNRT